MFSTHIPFSQSLSQCSARGERDCPIFLNFPQSNFEISPVREACTTPPSFYICLTLDYAPRGYVGRLVCSQFQEFTIKSRRIEFSKLGITACRHFARISSWTRSLFCDWSMIYSVVSGIRVKLVTVFLTFLYLLYKFCAINYTFGSINFDNIFFFIRYIFFDMCSFSYVYINVFVQMS